MTPTIPARFLAGSTEPVTAERIIDNDGRPYSTLYEAHISIGCICMVWAPPGNVEQERYANLIAEALNVAHETGLTPRQLLDVLRTIANGDYDNAHDPKAAARIARAAIADAEGATP